MPLTKKRKLDLKRSVEEKAKQIENPKEAVTFEYELTELITELNENLESCIDSYVSSSIPILRTSYQFRPNGVLSVLKHQEDLLRDMSQRIIDHIEPIKDAGFRINTAEYIKNIVDVCLKAVNKQYAKKLDKDKRTTN